MCRRTGPEIRLGRCWRFFNTLLKQLLDMQQLQAAIDPWRLFPEHRSGIPQELY